METRVSEGRSYRLTYLLDTIYEKCIELQKQAHHWAVDCQETEFAKLRAAGANALLAVTRLFKQNCFRFEKFDKFFTDIIFERYNRH